ncbi:MAG TPA: ion transporter [Gemmatales bacterium]|mgnify:CR=1 FL=1|nr:ion transporter [Gemmatales bacterium]HMP60406.1 ion transporter [Gemmatales bacterium]
MTDAVAKQRWRRRLWAILAVEDPNDPTTHRFGIALFLLIALNVLAVILESVRRYQVAFEGFFNAFELFSVAVFTVEYLVRLWACVEDPRYARPLLGRLRYMLTPAALIDLLAVLPFYLAITHFDLRFVRGMRLMRLARIAKLGRYSAAMRLLGHVFQRCREELLITVVLMMLMVVIASSFMYFAEHDAQPDKFPDIPSAMWWSIVTLTTVGYGDVFPVTTLGRVLAALVTIFGVGMVALPTGILGAAFVEEIRRQRTERQHCPHCGGEL